MRRCSISARASGLVNSRSGSRMLNGSLLALIAGLVLGRQRQRDVGAGIGILAEILHGLADAVAGPRIRQHQRKLRRIEQRPRFGRVPASVRGLARARRKMRLRFGDAVIVLDLVGHLQRAAGLTLRILGERNGRGAVGNRGEFPLRLTGGRADMRGAVAGDREMPFVGALGRLLGRCGLGHAAAGDHIERAAARAHDQRASPPGPATVRRPGIAASLFAADRMIGGLPV